VRYVNAQKTSNTKIPISLWDVQSENGVADIKRSNEFFDESKQERLKDIPLEFYTREALPFKMTCPHEKWAIIDTINYNRQLLKGNHETRDTSGAYRWFYPGIYVVTIMIVLNMAFFAVTIIIGKEIVLNMAFFAVTIIIGKESK
jgi:hypothetical protein